MGAGIGEVESFENAAVIDAYARWAQIYDAAFSRVTRPGRRAALAAVRNTSGLILDVGVGTGLELPMFDPDRSVYGVDLSQAMLARAAVRVRDHRLTQVAGLARMDASRLGFPDATFGCALAPFVLTAVPHPKDLLDELARVVRPGGEIILVNHISAEERSAGGIVGPWLERVVAPHLGWRLLFPWSIIGDWIAERPGLRLLERRRMPPFGLATLVRIERTPSLLEASAPAATRSPEPAGAQAIRDA